MADFKKRVELVIQITCIDDNEQVVSSIRDKEVLVKDFKCEKTLNDDFLKNRMASIILKLKSKLPDDFINYMEMSDSEQEFWDSRKDNRIQELNNIIILLKNKLHTMYISFNDLEINCRKSRDIAKDLFYG